MKLNKKQKEFCEEFYTGTKIDIEYPLINEKPDTIDEMMEYLQERVYEIEVIYYQTAMEYLIENDNSLQESCELAHDAGYETKSLNSELLATLLKQQEAQEKIYQYQDEIEELFYSNEK